MPTTERPTPRAASGSWSRLRGAATALVALVALSPIAACGSDGGTAAETVQQVVIEPEAPAVPLGRTTQLSASVRDASGTPLAGRTILWASADPSIAAVNGDGVVTPARVGRVMSVIGVPMGSRRTRSRTSAGASAMAAASPAGPSTKCDQPS